MTEGKNDIESASKAHADIVNKRRQARYLSPVLRVYGTVSKLTEGSGGSKTDGIMVNKK